MMARGPSPFHGLRRSRAFTLIELLVVLGIIAVLAGVAVPLFSRVTQNARAAACVSNLRQIGAGLNLYLGEHNMQMPTLLSGRKLRSDPGPVIDDTLNAYVTDPRVFACPADIGGWPRRAGRAIIGTSSSTARAPRAAHAQPPDDEQPDPCAQRQGIVPPLPDEQGEPVYADGHADKDFKFRTDDGSGAN